MGLGWYAISEDPLDLSTQITWAEHDGACGDLSAREPSHSVYVLGLQVDRRSGKEMRCPDEVPGLRLAVLVRHRKGPRELPERALNFQIVESEFLFQLAAQRFFGCLFRVYASAWAGPESVLELQTWPVKMD